MGSASPIIAAARLRDGRIVLQYDLRTVGCQVTESVHQNGWPGSLQLGNIPAVVLLIFFTRTLAQYVAVQSLSIFHRSTHLKYLLKKDMTVSELTREDVEFKTLDGLTLRGWLYPAAQRGPAMIMSPGVRNSHTS